jgi:lipopolysaccharide transport system ATP-binding protein
MAEDVVIRAEGLGKKFMIGHAAERERYVALRDVLVRGTHNLWRKTADMMRGRAIVTGDTVEEFWALKNVSFEVKRGEVLGIIGRNGAGKSTLLKILSRITEPSEGRVTISGRVSSLLEVGTGFHPELTGRENIYLNGAILGMTRAEIARKFDEIVAFAEVEKFLDTPVKRYSSGMYVRLAFAVAAHLEPEILVVDEVLAVGDAEFQKRCLGKMSEVAGGGRTILFVSHNMAAVQALCTLAVLLKSGGIAISGKPHTVIADHLRGRPSTALVERRDRQGSQMVKFISVAVYPLGAKPGDPVTLGDDTVIKLVCENRSKAIFKHVDLCIGIYDSQGRAVTFLENSPLNASLSVPPGREVFQCTIRRIPLVPGEYLINLNVYHQEQLLDWIQNASRFTIYPGNYYGTGKLPCTELGGVCLDHYWNIHSTTCALE